MVLYDKKVEMSMSNTQAYMFGCTFDTWSRSSSSCAYVVVVCLLGYLLPLLVIHHSYSRW